MTAQQRMEGLQAVLFDLDGTLIDTVELILESFRYTTKTVLGREIPDEELMEFVGCPLVVQMRGFDESRADELVTVYREYNALVHDQLIKGYPGVEASLAELRRREIPLGIITSKSHSVAQKGLDRFGLGEYFDVMVAFDDVELHKPDPHPLRVASDMMGVDLSACIYLGDSPHDMTAALAGDAIAVAALWGAFPRETVLRPGPHYALERMPQLLELIDGNLDEFAAARFSSPAN